ncbi:uncharacterized protein LOC129399157 [Sorex araneus]|uniref:uncharacterized protein LOC129399157 n=1 Tax=Sorex araneus TaxID=42254 RepID=UPI002433EFA0|nr:uncharacterized protein LOC129399157 [Sorex araneus]
MEPETSALSRPSLDLCHSQEDVREISPEFPEENVTYVELKVKGFSDTQKKRGHRILKLEASPWCLAAVSFAFLYLIVLIAAAAMTAKVRCLEEILKNKMNDQNGAEYCKII